MIHRTLFALAGIAALFAATALQAQQFRDYTVECHSCGNDSADLGRHDFCALNAQRSGGPDSRCSVAQVSPGRWQLWASDPFAAGQGPAQICHAICITYDGPPAPQPTGRYELVLVPGGVSFDSARQRARSMGGHLATITSAAELAAVWQVASNPGAWMSRGGNLHGPWLGGLRDGENRPWRWITSEPWVFDNWAPGQPDNYLGVEDRLHFFTAGDTRVPTWNDAPRDFRPRGFIVEY